MNREINDQHKFILDQQTQTTHLQTLLNTLRDILGLMESIPQFGCIKQLLPLDLSLLEQFLQLVTNFLLVTVDPRAVDVLVSGFDGGPDGGAYFARF